MSGAGDSRSSTILPPFADDVVTVYSDDPPSRAELDREEIEATERTEDNACPECDEGAIVPGPYERETGHYYDFCSRSCGWSA